jgi:hypothetical protein
MRLGCVLAAIVSAGCSLSLDFDRFQAPQAGSLALAPSSTYAHVGETITLKVTEKTGISGARATFAVEPKSAAHVQGDAVLAAGAARADLIVDAAGLFTVVAELGVVRSTAVALRGVEVPAEKSATRVIALASTAVQTIAEIENATNLDTTSLPVTAGGLATLWFSDGRIDLDTSSISCRLIGGPATLTALGRDGLPSGGTAAFTGSTVPTATLVSAQSGPAPARGVRIAPSSGETVSIDECEAPLGAKRPDPDPWADGLAGADGLDPREDPKMALGPQDDRVVTLGAAGSIVVSFEEGDAPSAGGAGLDLVVVERGAPEDYKVAVSSNGITFVDLPGTYRGVAAMPVPPGGPFRFVRVQSAGATDQSADPRPGPDIDAVLAITVSNVAARVGSAEADVVVAANLDTSAGAPLEHFFAPNAIGPSDGALVWLAQAPAGSLTVMFADNVCAHGSDGMDVWVEERSGASYKLLASADGQRFTEIGQATGAHAFDLTAVGSTRFVRIEAVTGMPTIDTVRALHSSPVP